MAAPSENAPSPPKPPSERSTAAFRAEHEGTQRDLDRLLAAVADIRGHTGSEQSHTMRAAISVFDDHLRRHMDWEERVLYPLIDKLTGSPADYPFTAAMRREHRIIERWIAELGGLLDWTLFAHKVERLVGLVSAHLECENEVLLSVLDHKLTREQLDETLGPHEG